MCVRSTNGNLRTIQLELVSQQPADLLRQRAIDSDEVQRDQGSPLTCHVFQHQSLGPENGQFGFGWPIAGSVSGHPHIDCSGVMLARAAPAFQSGSALTSPGMAADTNTNAGIRELCSHQASIIGDLRGKCENIATSIVFGSLGLSIPRTLICGKTVLD